MSIHEQENNTPMGEVINFPRHHDGSPVRATAERLDQPGLEQEPPQDTETRAVERVERGPIIPPALAGKVRSATISAGRHAVRHGSYLAGGVWTLSSRAVARAMHRDLTAAIRQARAAGDYGTLAELEQQRRDSANARWTRIKTMLEITATVGKVAIGAAGVFAAVTLAVLVYAGITQIGELFPSYQGGQSFASIWTDGYWAAVQNIASWALWVASLWPLAVGGAMVAGLVAAYRTGKEAEIVPAFAKPTDAETEGRDVIPDEGAILNALRNLNLAPLNRKFKDGWRPRWVLGTGRDGRGWRTQLELPAGVTVDMINDKKDVLAHNLVRLPVEVWPTEPKNKPGVLDLWVADQGSLTGPVDPWPLLHDGTTDYFKGVPVGVNPKGDTVIGKFAGANWGVAGMMGSGKSTLIITALLGAMLDPLVEIDVFCMAYNADYDPLEPRLRTLAKGDEEENIAAALEGLRSTFADLSERGKILSERDEVKLTREIAETDSRMRPRIVVIDECQELFTHEEYGEEAAELVSKMVAKARKYGVTLLFATPVPSADSIPRKVAKVLSNKACFAIGDHQGNDAILGSGKHKAGITATTLRPMTDDDPGDIGTAMTVGFTAQDGLMRSYYVPRGNGVDEVTPVVERALALREEAKIAAGGSPVEERDVLGDTLAVMGTEPARAGEVVKALGARWARYQGWKIKDLVAALGAFGVKVPSTDRLYLVDPNAVRDAKAQRDAEENASGDE